MTPKSLFIALFILFSVSGCSRYGGVDSPTGSSSITPKVYMEPASITVTSSGSFTIKVYVENVTDLYYAAFDLVYDTAKVTLPDNNWAQGAFLQQDGASIYFSVGGEQPISGTMVKRNIGVSRLSSPVGVSGNGVLCSFTFNAAAAGTATIEFNQDPTSWGFMNVNNSPITITVGNGTTVNIL